jgi:predicted glycoside hydrolase/deacetylase ChbG (UPF0249 family)
VRYLIINADGYGFTKGISRAIEECIEFGTVRSLSANVNFIHAEGLARLVQKHPHISVGCHINPVVGIPVLPAEKVPTLLDKNGEFLYETFSKRFLTGHIRLAELRAEMIAQVEKTRDMAGQTFSHIDFHMGLHRFPGLYSLFLEVAEKSGVKRIRTHRYLVGMESRFPYIRHAWHVLKSPARTLKFGCNLWLRRKALAQNFVMPDRRAEITDMGFRPGALTIQHYLMLLKNIPQGFSEFVVHPGYVDDNLRRWSTYIDQRVLERQLLLNSKFRDALYSSDIHLSGYRDIPLN